MSPIILDPPAADPRTFLELQDEVLAHGFDATTYRARVKQWLNEAQRRIVRGANLPARYVTHTATIVAGVAAYTLPADVIRIDTVRDSIDDFTLEALNARDFDDLATATGTPTRYLLTGSQLTIHPTPRAAGSITVRYWAASAQLVNDGDIPQIPDDYTDLLVEYALMKAYRAEDDFEAANQHDAVWQRELALMRSDVHRPARDGIRQIPGMWADGNPRPTFVRP